jgi:hypothetical protein
MIKFPNVRVESSLEPKRNVYNVYIDGALFCWTQNDDDGLKLQITIVKLEQIRKERI